MAFPTAELQIQRFANALYNVQLGSTTMDAVLDNINTLADLDPTFNYVYSVSFGGMTTAQVTETLLANMNIVSGQYGLTDDIVGAVRTYINGVLSATPANGRGAVVSQLTSLWATLGDDPTFGAAVDAWNAEIDDAMAWEGTADVIAGTDNPVNTFFELTANQDFKAGTNGDDTFFGDVVQVGGAQVNSLGTGDNLDGGAGTDSLIAQITKGVFLGNVYGDGNMPVMPRTMGIEHVELEAIFNSLDYNSSDNVFFSAKNMRNVDFIGSNHSDADLIIQDLTVDPGEITADMTIGMAYTGNADHMWDASDLEVYFDEDDLLRADPDTDSSVQYAMLDQTSHAATGGELPLQFFPLRGIQFVIDGQTIVIPVTAAEISDIGNNNDVVGGAEQYDDVVDLLNGKLAALLPDNPVLGGLSFSRSNETFQPIPVDGTFGYWITLADSNGRAITGQETIVDTQSTQGNIHWDARPLPPTSTDQLITVQVELEKVGRGGDGGELIIGGMNKGEDNIWGEGSSLKPAGVEQFNVTVLGDDLLPSSLAAMHSTNNALQVVNIASEAGAALGDAAALIIGNSNTDTGGEGLGTLIGNAGALKDVQVLNASNFLGDLTVYAALTDEVVAKYMDLQDSQADPAEDNAEFVYTLGQGNDHLNLVISNSTLEAAGTTTREDFELTISGGAGNDLIEFMIGDGDGQEGDIWYANSNLNNTNDQAGDVDPRAYIEISGGEGDDTIVTFGAGDLVINGDAGSDTIYTENSGAFARWYLNFDLAILTDPATILSDVNDAYATLTDGVDIDTLFTATVTVTFKGLTSTVTFNSTDATFTDLELNQALKNAINNNSVLNKLLVAFDGPANALVIDTLIDGVTADELSFTVTNEAGADVTPGATYSEVFIAGTDGVNASDNEITPGTGTSDVVVLGTYAGDEDNIIYDAVNSGRDTIVNFLVNVDASGVALAGNDTFDFTPLTGTASGANFGAGFFAADGSITLVAQNAANDTAAEIKALFDADAAEDATVSQHIFIAYTADNAVANAWLIEDGALANDSVVTAIGVIDLADVSWATLVNANFV